MSKNTFPVNGGAMPSSSLQAEPNSSSKAHFGYNPSIKERRSFIGGSDARIIMGNDEARLVRLWREKRGEIVPEDLSNWLERVRAANLFQTAARGSNFDVILS